MKKGIFFGVLLGLLLLGSQTAFCMKKKSDKSETLCPELINQDVFLIILNFVSLKKMILLCAKGKSFNKQINRYLINYKLNSQRVVHITAKMLKNAIESGEHRKGLCAFLGKNKAKVSLDFSGNYIFEYTEKADPKIDVPQIITNIIDCCKEQLVELLIIKFMATPDEKKQLFSQIPKKLKRLSLKGHSSSKPYNLSSQTNLNTFTTFPITPCKLGLVSKLTHLQQLTLDGIQYNETQKLHYLSPLKNLRILYLKFSACLINICLKPLQKLTKLKKLVLANDDIPPKQSFEMLNMLFSSGGSVNDNQLVYLPHDLEHLVITIPSITDKGVRNYIVYLTKLKSIRLMSDQITKKSKKLLQKMLPNLKEKDIKIN